MSLPQLPNDGTAQELQRLLVRGVPDIDCALVDVQTEAVTTVQRAKHRLGRPYRGGDVVCASDAVELTVLYPAGREDTWQWIYFKLSNPVAVRATLKVF